MAARRLLRWSGRERDGGRLELRPGDHLALAALEDYRGFGEGWARPEDPGIWTLGPRSDLDITVEGIEEGDYTLTFFIMMTWVASGDTLTVALSGNDTLLATRHFRHDPGGVPWRVELPASMVADRDIDFTLRLDAPRSAVELGRSHDDRELGLFVRSVGLERVDRSLSLGETVVFSEGSGAERFLGDGWSTLEPTGVWTIEERAQLVLDLPDSTPTDAQLLLDLTAFVAPEHPEVAVQIRAGDEELAARVLCLGDADGALAIPVARALADDGRRLCLELQVRDPARPADVGLSDDPRRLGVHLRSLTAHIPPAPVVREAGHLRLGRLRREVVRSLRH